MSRPLVSILIPAYNAQHTLQQTIDCALGQTWARTEIIVVNDGSKDRTLDVARSVRAKNLQVITQENQGAAAARNAAYSHAQGDLIQWLDADDLLAPDKIALQVQAAEALNDPRALLSSRWGSFYYRPERAWFKKSALWATQSPADWLYHKLLGGAFMQTATWLVSRDLSSRSGEWNTQLLGDDDGEYFCRVLSKASTVHFVPEATVYYRVPTAASLSYIGRDSRKQDAQFLSMRLHIETLGSLENSDRVRHACIEYLQQWVFTFYPERPDLFEQADQLSRTFGGILRPPELSWKYRWIQQLFGWSAAKGAYFEYNKRKDKLRREWDRLLWQWQGT